MSLNPRFLLIGSVALVGGLAAGAVLQMQSLKTSRLPASAPSKSALFQPQQLRISKPNQMVDVHIEAIGGFPAFNDQEVVLRATIQLERPIDGNLNFSWLLPEGSQLISGQVRGALTNLQPGQSVTQEITLTGFSSEGRPRNVGLDIAATSDSSLVGATAVFRSHPTRSDLSIGFRPTKKGSGNFSDEPTYNSKASSTETESEVRPSLPPGIRF